MKKSFKVLSLVLALLLILGPLGAFAASPGDLAYGHVRTFSEDMPRRIAGGPAEKAAAEYIEEQFSQMGYTAEMQPFSYTRRGVVTHSQNVIAVKAGSSSREIIVGAHYDSVAVGTGADDNSSGVAVMLEVAERLANVNTAYTIRFIAFGAEEVGLQGSNYIARNMSTQEIANTAAMINLDTLLGGDFMYVYSGLNGPGWVRDQALSIAGSLGLNLQTNPGLNPRYPAGMTGDWSDHAPFRLLGIPVAYFEATNWEIGDLDGYDQTVRFGPIMHSARDSLAFVEANFPGRAMERMYTFTSVLYHLLLQFAEPAEVEQISPQGAVVQKDTWNANATIPFKFTTIGDDGEARPMENVSVRVFDRDTEVAVYTGNQVRMLGHKGDYMVNINTKHLGLSDGLYIVLIEFVDAGNPVVYSSFLTLK